MLHDNIKMLSNAKILDQNNQKYTGAAVYDIAGYTLSKPTDAAVIMRFVVPRSMTIKSTFPGATAISSVAPAANVNYSIKRNGVEIGRMEYVAGATVGTFTDVEAGDHVFNSGDILTVEAPATADANHDGLAFTLVAEI